MKRKPRPDSLLVRFADELARHDIASGDKGGSVPACARRLGISPLQANALMQKIRKQMNDAQRAAGFGDWAV